MSGSRGGLLLRALSLLLRFLGAGAPGRDPGAGDERRHAGSDCRRAAVGDVKILRRWLVPVILGLSGSLAAGAAASAPAEVPAPATHDEARLGQVRTGVRGSRRPQPGGLAPPVSALRSVSYYLYLPDADGNAIPIPADQMLAYEQIDFPGVRAAGFNAVLLVFFQELLEKPETVALQLEAARANNLAVILGLNYWTGDLVTDRASFHAWLARITTFLTAIDAYRDMVYPVVFWEGQTSMDPAAVRATLGAVPAHLDPALRARWRLGWNGGALDHASRQRSADGYDFVCTSRYFFDASISLWWVPEKEKGLSDDRVKAELEDFYGRVRAVYTEPIFFFEGGYYTCRTETFLRAAEVYAGIARWATGRGLGWNLWGYRTLLTPEDECVQRGGKGGHSLSNPDGSARPALAAVTAVLRDRPRPIRVGRTWGTPQRESGLRVEIPPEGRRFGEEQPQTLLALRVKEAGQLPELGAHRDDRPGQRLRIREGELEGEIGAASGDARRVEKAGAGELRKEPRRA
jgi:hypothetical protein